MSPQRRLAGEYSGSRRALQPAERRGGSRRATAEEWEPASGAGRTSVRTGARLTHCPRPGSEAECSGGASCARGRLPGRSPPLFVQPRWRSPTRASRTPTQPGPAALCARGPGRFGFSEKRNVAGARCAGRAFLRAGASLRAAQGTPERGAADSRGKRPGSRGRRGARGGSHPGLRSLGAPSPRPMRWHRSRGAGGSAGVGGRPPGGRAWRGPACSGRAVTRRLPPRPATLGLPQDARRLGWVGLDSAAGDSGSPRPLFVPAAPHSPPVAPRSSP